MVFGKVKGALFKIFKHGHPDVYDLLKKYCDERGLDVSDVTASATLTWMTADETAKKDVEEAMKQRRLGGSSSGGDVKAGLEMFKDICGAMGEMFKAMNEARAGMSLTAMLSDFKAVSGALTEMKKAGSEAGAGSTEDMLATAFFTALFGGKKGEKAAKTKTGEGKVQKVED